MSAAALVGKTPFSGLRPVNLRTDLGGMADLIEICFGPTMDETGRAGVREWRMVAQSNSMSFLYSGLDRALGGLEQGFVWIEGGLLVGNVTISPANYPRSMGKGYIVANVAVHPDYRGRGLAHELMQAALDLIRSKGGQFAILQVDVDNEIAKRLYTRFSFRAERAFIRWQRAPYLRPPQRLPDMPFMTLRQANEWRAEYALAELVRPNSQGGLGWLRPTHPDLFRPALLRTLADWTIARSEEHWIVRRENGREILASLRATLAFGGPDRLELLVHPAQQTRLTEPMINYALRRLEGRRRTAIIEHPADDAVTTRVMEQYQFQRRSTTLHMRYTF